MNGRRKSGKFVGCAFHDFFYCKSSFAFKIPAASVLPAGLSVSTHPFLLHFLHKKTTHFYITYMDFTEALVYRLLEKNMYINKNLCNSQLSRKNLSIQHPWWWRLQKIARIQKNAEKTKANPIFPKAYTFPNFLCKVSHDWKYLYWPCVPFYVLNNE